MFTYIYILTTMFHLLQILIGVSDLVIKCNLSLLRSHRISQQSLNGYQLCKLHCNSATWIRSKYILECFVINTIDSYFVKQENAKASLILWCNKWWSRYRQCLADKSYVGCVFVVIVVAKTHLGFDETRLKNKQTNKKEVYGNSQKSNWTILLSAFGTGKSTFFIQSRYL